MNADALGQTPLPTTRRKSFSPDGKQIAFMSNRGLQGDMEIFLMNVDGSGETRITNNTSLEGHHLLPGRPASPSRAIATATTRCTR